MSQMTLHLELLSDNFQEIYHALHSTEKKGLNLVSNPSGTRIYDATRGWGRLWRWFYQIIEWATGKGTRLNKLKDAILYTHNVFQAQLPLIQRYLIHYEKYLKQSAGGYAVNEDNYFISRKVITHWNASTGPFVKLMQRQSYPKMNQLLHYCFGQELSRQQTKQLFSSPDTERLKQCQKIINLEGILQGPLPLAIFKKFIKNKPLNALEYKELDKWIKKANKISPDVRLFHEALAALTFLWKKDAEKPIDDTLELVRLEAFLEERGCAIFQKEDPKHIQWRRQLKKGVQLAYKENIITLGNQIVPSTSRNDRTLVFNLDNSTNHVVLTAQNKVVLPLKKFKQQHASECGIEPAKILDVLEDGRWGIMEKLKPLNSRKWSSVSGSISNEDRTEIESIKNLLQSFVRKNFTPESFSKASLMFDSQNQLKTLKSTSKCAFDFNALEDFIYQFSSGNLTIFQYLMENTGLSSHLTAQFYCDMIANALRGDLAHADDMAGIYKISDPKVVDRTNLLTNQVVTLQKQLCAKILELHPDLDFKSIETKVNNQILLCHKATKASGILWPGLAQEVLEKFV